MLHLFGLKMGVATRWSRSINRPKIMIKKANFQFDLKKSKATTSGIKKWQP
jgi:hypothetical protein